LSTTTTKRVRWECPTGKHPGVLASTRPTKDSIVRYCLRCSVETGKLALRIAPALERKRSAAAESTATKAKAKRAREAVVKARKLAAENERYIIDGLDLRVEMKKLLKLKAFGGKTGRLYRNPPTLVVSRRTSSPRAYVGLAEPWRNQITIVSYPGLDSASVRETLVHELTHIVLGGCRTGTSKNQWHGPQFRQTLTAAFKEAYKVLPVGLSNFHAYGGGYANALRRREKAASEGGAA
jgi:hypothetical protein